MSYEIYNDKCLIGVVKWWILSLLYDKRTLSFRSISTAEEKGIITVLAKVLAFGVLT